MAKYPKPDGYQGGPDGGHFLRTGSGGHLGMNPALADDYTGDQRRNADDIGEFCLTEYGSAESNPFYDGDEAQGLR